MVSIGRIACITTPFILSLAALVCLVLVFLAGTVEHNNTLDDLYFMKIELNNLTLSSSANLLATETNANLTNLAGALEVAKQSLGIQDYYTIYLRNYCAWNGNDKYANCSDTKSYFWFDPVAVWNLNQTGVDIDTILPSSLNAGLDTYKAASKAVFVLYCAAIATTAITLLVGFSAIFSRWGSFITTFFATVASISFIGASGLATAMFYILHKAIDRALEDEAGVKSVVGTKMLSLTWIGTAFAVGSGFFWLLSICCCSGRSPYNPGSKEARRTRAEKTPYTYERVGSPYLGPNDSQSVPLSTFGAQQRPQHQQPSQAGPNHNAYEPFRVQQV